MYNISISRKSELNDDMDGVLHLQDLSGQAQIRTNPLDLDVLSPDQPNDYVNASGKLFKGMKDRRKQRQSRKNLKTKSKADARTLRARAGNTRAGAKVISAQAQDSAARALGSSSESSAPNSLPLQEPLNVKDTTGLSKEAGGMSTGLKIGIGVGAVVLLGTIGFFVWKASKGK